jgi:hypothetical protein
MDNRAGQVFLQPKSPKTAFSFAPPHTPELVKRGKDYSDGYMNGFFAGAQSDCNNVSDWCRGYMVVGTSA